MDLHAGQVHGFFSIPVDHLTAIPIIANYIKTNFDCSSLVAVAADAGGASRAGKFAQYVDIPLAIIDKRRISDTEVKQGHVVGDVENQNVVIFEDEISTGTTLLSTEKTLRNAGASRIFAGAIHPVLCGPAKENLENAIIEQFIVTNTVDVPPEKNLDKITVLSVAPLFAEAIRRIHTGESVGSLFD
jgi:ribose-phosphate pyrophosphokinase